MNCLLLAIVVISCAARQHVSKYDMFVSKGNLVWGGAMNLAWSQLSDEIIKDKIKLNTKNRKALSTVNRFNNPVFSVEDIKAEDYYVKAGYGQETVKQINDAMKQKFPDNSFGALKDRLNDDQIISYAYLRKKVEYPHKFDRLQNFDFDGTLVKGFQAKNSDQKSNLKIVQYTSDDSFVLKVNTKSDTEVYLIKSPEQLSADQAVDLTNSTEEEYFPSRDYFRMPIVHIDAERQYKDVQRIPFANKGFENYEIAKMIENIKLDMDEVGVRVQNQAKIIMMTRSMRYPKKPRYFYLNKPFWIVIKEQGHRPLLIAKINQINE